MSAVYSAVPATRAGKRIAAPKAVGDTPKANASRFAADLIAKRGPLIESNANNAGKRNAFEEQTMQDQAKWLNGLRADDMWHDIRPKKV